jgi:hypothetical protein
MLELPVENKMEDKKRAEISQLRQQLRVLERAVGRRSRLILWACRHGPGAGGGLATGCLHEVIGATGDGAATASWLPWPPGSPPGNQRAGRHPLVSAPARSLWTGLGGCRAGSARLILAATERATDGLWAMEEGAGRRPRGRGGRDGWLSLTATRRLQLAADRRRDRLPAAHRRACRRRGGSGRHPLARHGGDL